MGIVPMVAIPAGSSLSSIVPLGIIIGAKHQGFRGG